jgi:hypothetical protein
MSEQRIERFYAPIDRRDGDAMAACYAHDAQLSTRLPASARSRAWRHVRMLRPGARAARLGLLAHGATATAGCGAGARTYVSPQTAARRHNDVVRAGRSASRNG